MNTLAGRAVVVTGSGQGLGRAYALAAAAAGASVVVNDVGETATETAAEIESAGGRAIAVVGSVADWAIAERLTADCVATFGRIDGFVANAAIMRQGAPWDETEESLRAVVEVNVLGVQFGVRHAMKAMVDAGRGGSIVTVVSGARLGIRGMSAYGASKGAVAAMTANWAIEGEPHGIRVNAVSPLGQTAMARQDVRAEVPDFPDPDAVAPVVVALLDDATAGLTGRIVRFDGERLSLYDTVLDQIAERSGWTAGEVGAALAAAVR
jgi:NAD(P)-dependent dehydrogenase (short-subunit alcohol dehydrogenase family)